MKKKPFITDNAWEYAQACQNDLVLGFWGTQKFFWDAFLHQIRTNISDRVESIRKAFEKKQH